MAEKTLSVPQEQGSRPAAPGRWRRILSARETGISLALVLMCVALSFATPYFLRPDNLLNVGRQVSLLGIMAIGATFVLVSGEIDLSVGSAYAICGIAVGMLLLKSWPLIPALAAGLALGALIGLINGWLSTFGRLPSFITTLGMLNVVRGAALLLTSGSPVTVDKAFGGIPSVLDSFYFLGQGRLLNLVPMQLTFFIVIAPLGWILLSRTTLGFRMYAAGGSNRAARVSGIDVFGTKIWAFVLAGILTASAGILSMAFLASAQAGTTGVGIELNVIAAVIVGGTGLSGGEGTILGTVVGVLILGVLQNGLVLLGISPFWQTIFVGGVIILAVGVDKWTKSRRNG